MTGVQRSSTTALQGSAPQLKTYSAASLTAVTPRRRFEQIFRVFAQKKAVFGGLLLLLMIGATVFAPVLSPFDPDHQDIANRLQPPVWSGGSAAHLLGTDHLGRDMLSRIMFGGRVSLLIGASAVLVSGTIGVVLGLLSGFYGGRVDALLMRVADVQLAFPQILLVLLVLVILGRSLAAIVVVLALADWVIYARLVRGRLLVERQKEYVEAAHASGANGGRIMLRHLLPNVTPLIIVIATLQLGLMIILESSLSYVGVGVEPPTSSWGRMLNDGQMYMAVAWWVSTLPGLAIVFTVLGVNFLGDGLRQALGVE
jgi:peptide/nickel transport system permease protein